MTKHISNFIILTCLLLNINHLSAQPIKRTLVEEYTGTWCASCGFGSIYSQHLEDNYPNSVMVAIHSSDVMQNLDVVLYMTEYFDALPTFLYDRVDFPSNPEDAPAVSAYPWPTGLDTLDHYLDMQYDEIPIATVGIDQVYNADTREITATITVNFIEDATGEFRLNCFILEDSVTGGSEYDQTNTNFSGWTDGPDYLTPLIESPSIIEGYVHDHVLREMLGTPTGISASIPTSVESGSSYSKIFTYTVPEEYNENQISLVGMVQRYGPSVIDDRRVVNTMSQHLYTGTSSIDENLTLFSKLSIYPNPVTNKSQMEFYVKKTGHLTGKIYDATGELVKIIFDSEFVQGEHRVDFGELNLDAGMYLISIKNGTNHQTQKIIIW